MSSIEKLTDITREKTILYVEDEKDIQKQGEILFSKLFKKVFVANNGEEGLKIFQEEMPDIIITDILMPKLDGTQMTKRIKNVDLETPIIALTATNELKPEELEQLFFTVLDKPIKLDLIIKTLEEVFL